MCCWAAVAASAAEPALEHVTLQLKWKHQFQFAGYYAAIAQGYYHEAGLDVELREAQPGADPVESVINGTADFGVGTSELLLLRGQGKPVVVLAAIFQHSPLVLLTRRTSEVSDLQALHNQPIMIEPQSAELFAYFRDEGIDPAKLHIVHHTFEVRDLLERKVAAMSAYETDEPFLLRQAGVEYLVFTPRAGGIDFYGDNLFTTERVLRESPERVRRFREASLRGWDYALAHPQEIIALIQQRYGQRKSREHLEFEATQTAQLMHPGLIEVGHMNPGRWRHMADTYAEFGMLPRGFDLGGFLYDPNPRPDFTWVYWTLGMAALGLIAALGWVLPLVRLNRRLRAADESKTRFLAFLTHEIRTPLNGMAGVVELLKAEALTASQRELIELQERSAKNLVRLVDSVLDYSRLGAGKMTVERTPVEVRTFTADVCELFRTVAQARRVDLRYSIAENVPTVVVTDGVKLRQILANLLSNAVKFTVAGQVSLRVEIVPQEKVGPLRLKFRVSDTGPGIPPETQTRLFQPFEQADATVGRRHGGSGLGLNISRGLARLLGGDITVESQVGVGSTFSVEIVAHAQSSL